MHSGFPVIQLNGIPTTISKRKFLSGAQETVSMENILSQVVRSDYLSVAFGDMVVFVFYPFLFTV
jgi:hypothetical protein